MSTSMTKGSPLKLMLSFALPLLAGNLLQQTYNIIDAAIVGQVLGSDALASVGASSSVQFLVLGFCMGSCTGFGVPVAKYFGGNNLEKMRDYIFKKGYLVDVVNEAIQNLINNDYLDDDRFTKAYIKDKMAFTSKGDYKIRMELSNLGIDNGIIDNNILMIDNDMLFNKMKKIIDKDIKNNKKYNGSELRNKIYNHLISQGYSKEKVINIINTYDF